MHLEMSHSTRLLVLAEPEGDLAVSIDVRRMESFWMKTQASAAAHAISRLFAKPSGQERGGLLARPPDRPHSLSKTPHKRSSCSCDKVSLSAGEQTAVKKELGHS